MPKRVIFEIVETPSIPPLSLSSFDISYDVFDMVRRQLTWRADGDIGRVVNVFGDMVDSMRISR